MISLDSALGVEVTVDALVLVSVKRGIKEYAVASHLRIPAFRDLPRPELIRRVEEFLSGNGFNRENVFVCLPRSSVIVRELQLPLEVEENLDQVLEFQVDKLEPLEEGASYFDHLVLKRDEASKQLLIQVIMARPEEVEELLELFKELGIYPAQIGYASWGLHQVLHAHLDGHPNEAAALILRCGPTSTEFIVLTSDRQIFTDSVEYSELPDVDFLLTEAASFVSGLVDPIKEFSKIYLTGECAGEVSGALKERTEDVAILTKGLKLNFLQGLKAERDAMMPAVGLAISRMKESKRSHNLIPKEKRFVGGQPSLVPTFLLVGLLLVLAGGLFTRDFFQKQRLVEKVDAEIALLQPQVDQALRLREQVAAREKELTDLADLLQDRQGALLILKDLTERIPEETYLQNFQIQGDRVTMQGYSDQASGLLPLLLESPYLEDVKTNWITQDARSGGKDRFNFTATVKK
ncbi:MAG: PilN domain-containing protein [Acidobacteriota bacterium]|nr:MAG: PilN domain-containing protein [Acidobacteriota bacterium]